MTRDDVIRLGEAANRLLNDETAMHAFAQVMEDMRMAWAESRPDDVMGRESCYRLVLAVNMVMDRLKSYASNARLEVNNAEVRERESRVLN